MSFAPGPSKRNVTSAVPAISMDDCYQQAAPTPRRRPPKLTIPAHRIQPWQLHTTDRRTTKGWRGLFFMTNLYQKLILVPFLHHSPHHRIPPCNEFHVPVWQFRVCVNVFRFRFSDTCRDLHKIGFQQFLRRMSTRGRSSSSGRQDRRHSNSPSRQGFVHRRTLSTIISKTSSVKFVLGFLLALED